MEEFNQEERYISMDGYNAAVAESMAKAIWTGPKSFPQYASTPGDVGVELPAGPGSDESGFNEVDIPDTRELAATAATDVVGIQLPGNSRWEPGYTYGEDYRELAPRQDAPVGMNFGAMSDTNPGLQPGGEMEPFIHVVGRTPANQFDSPTAADILPAFEGMRDKFGGSTPSTGGPVPGMDSMAGLPLGVGSGIVGGEGYMGEDGSFGTGDGDQDQDDFNRYPDGPVFRPGQGVKPQGAPSTVLGKQSV